MDNLRKEFESSAAQLLYRKWAIFTLMHCIESDHKNEKHFIAHRVSL
jgi:hypothetical protein